jgi:Tol biopolymer transport system component
MRGRPDGGLRGSGQSRDEGTGRAERPLAGTISYWSERGGRGAQVDFIRADGSGLRRITDEYSAKRAVWRPDGRRIAGAAKARPTPHDFDIFVANADGNEPRRITRGPERDTQPSWSPNGHRIAFSRVRREGDTPEIWIATADGKAAHRIHTGGDDPAWSPDGRRIAFATATSVSVMDADGARSEASRRAANRRGRRTVVASCSPVSATATPRCTRWTTTAATSAASRRTAARALATAR